MEKKDVNLWGGVGWGGGKEGGMEGWKGGLGEVVGDKLKPLKCQSCSLAVVLWENNTWS